MDKFVCTFHWRFGDAVPGSVLLARRHEFLPAMGETVRCFRSKRDCAVRGKRLDGEVAWFDQGVAWGWNQDRVEVVDLRQVLPVVGPALSCFLNVRDRFYFALAGTDVDSLQAEDLYQDLK